MNPLRLPGREPKGIIWHCQDISKDISFLSNKYITSLYFQILFFNYLEITKLLIKQMVFKLG